MIFPTSYSAVLLVALLSLVLGVAWVLPFRAAGKWRFELFGIDFGLGVVLGALSIGFTLGTMGSEITFYDNIMIMRKSSVMFLIGFGAVANLGVLLLLAALSLTGAAVTFLVGVSMAAVTTAVGMHLVLPLVSPAYLGIGCILLLAALGLAGNAHSTRVQLRETDLLQKAVAAGIKGKIPRTSRAKGLLVAAIGGLLIGLLQPIAIWAQSRDEIGFGAYSMGALVAVAFVFGTPFFSLFLLNLPVQGEALSFGAWFKGTGRQHVMGMAGGWLWFAGLTALLLAATATPGAGLGRGVAFALSRGSIIAGALIGIFVHGDFANYLAARSKALMALGVAAAGLIVFSLGRV